MTHFTLTLPYINDQYFSNCQNGLTESVNEAAVNEAVAAA